MKAGPFVAAGAAVVAATASGVRRYLRRRTHPTEPGHAEHDRPRQPADAPAYDSAGRPERQARLGDAGLVAGREIRERVRGRVFRVVTSILFAVVAAAVIIPTIHGGTGAPPAVGVVGGSAALAEEIRAVARSTGLTIRLVDERDDASARTALRDGRIALAVEAPTALLVDKALAATDTSNEARFVRTLSLALGLDEAFRSAGLTPAQAATVTHARSVPVHSLQPAKVRTSAEATSLIGVILVFIVLTQYLTWTLIGVMEEKANRIVEVLLATVRPIELLTGKLLGIGTVALLQAGALVVFALVLGEAVGSSLVHGAAPQVLAATFVWLVLGYALYSWLYAAAGSLAERQDQVQTLALPLSAPLILGYVASLTAAGGGHASLFVEVLAYVPPTAPFAMPVLVGLGQVAWWEFLASALVTVIATVGVALAATQVYRRAVLRTGRRIRLRDLAAGSTA